MDTEGTYDARNTRADRVPSPPGHRPPRHRLPAYAPPPAALLAPPVGECRAPRAPAGTGGVALRVHAPPAPRSPRRPSVRSLWSALLAPPRSRGRLLGAYGYRPKRLVPPSSSPRVGCTGTFRRSPGDRGADAGTVFEAALFGLPSSVWWLLGNWLESLPRHAAGRGDLFLPRHRRSRRP